MSRAASDAPALAPQATLGEQDTEYTGSKSPGCGVGRGSVFLVKCRTSVYHFSS